jgi:hypothetical protein
MVYSTKVPKVYQQVISMDHARIYQHSNYAATLTITGGDAAQPVRAESEEA